MQTRLFDIGWRDESECQPCHREEGTEKHRLCHSSEWHETRRGIPGAFRKVEQKARTSKKVWKWQRGIATHPLSESQWNRGHFSMKKWESEKHRGKGIPAEGFKGHVATDGSLLCTAGKWRACGWSVVQLDYDEDLVPLHGMYGPMEAEIEVQRTIKRAELTRFLCLVKKVIGPKAADADLWIKIWKELHFLAARDFTVEVERQGQERDDAF